MEREKFENGEIRKKNGREAEDAKEEHPLPLMALNHVSRLCRNVKQSMEFYTKVLGFVPIELPQALDHLDGAWLFNYGIGVHLVQADDQHRLVGDTHHLDPIDNHISFQCENVEAIEQKLKELGVKYMKTRLEDDGPGTEIEQLFFNDPDGFMIEICTCENLKLVPLDSSSNIKLPPEIAIPPLWILEMDMVQNDSDFISPAKDKMCGFKFWVFASVYTYLISAALCKQFVLFSAMEGSEKKR